MALAKGQRYLLGFFYLGVLAQDTCLAAALFPELENIRLENAQCSAESLNGKKGMLYNWDLQRGTKISALSLAGKKFKTKILPVQSDLVLLTTQSGEKIITLSKCAFPVLWNYRKPTPAPPRSGSAYYIGGHTWRDTATVSKTGLDDANWPILGAGVAIGVSSWGHANNWSRIEVNAGMHFGYSYLGANEDGEPSPSDAGQKLNARNMPVIGIHTALRWGLFWKSQGVSLGPSIPIRLDYTTLPPVGRGYERSQRLKIDSGLGLGLKTNAKSFIFDLQTHYLWQHKGWSWTAVIGARL